MYIPFPLHSLANEGTGAITILDRKCRAGNKKSYRRKRYLLKNTSRTSKFRFSQQPGISKKDVKGSKSNVPEVTQNSWQQENQ
jgi:hypothetical protein